MRAIVERFYDPMDLEPAFAGIRALHAPALDYARELDVDPHFPANTDSREKSRATASSAATVSKPGTA